ncbi:translation machinery-associated protein 16 [Mucor velutinosus]|uniref:Translation machinery-associated protein 16 n=1 Tax=Mucor velutinosus TaxID=708070 RepID=A0AAN7I2C4_9FUNG|nr:translation machinery-associated protein 16 [Mucor velutinosus]
MIHIKSSEEINALNQHGIISAQPSEITHTKANTVARIPTSRKKTAQIAPNDFEQWIKSHGGDKGFVDLINTKVAPRKRRSLLSNVPFAYSSDESSNSEGEEEDDFDTLATVATIPKKVVKGSKHSATPKKTLTTVTTLTTSQTITAPIKKSNWLTGLFHKQPKSSSSSSSSTSLASATTSPPKPPIYKTHEPVPVPLTNKTVNISQFFSNKKKPTNKPKEQAKKIPNLPKRYPIPIERVIYEISWMKLNNPSRPLQHHVSISNMLVWYTNMVDNRQTLLYLRIPARSTSAHVSAAAVSRLY